MDIEIEGLNFPSEDELRLIEDNHGISVLRDYFVSREFYNAHHQEGKDIPARLYNGGRKDGTHIPIVEMSGVYYVALFSSKAQKDPIKRHQGRKRER